MSCFHSKPSNCRRAVFTLFWGFRVVHHGCNGQLPGVPDGTHVCGVHMYTWPRWIRVRTHVHASRCMRMRVYSFTVSDCFPIRRVSEYSTCESRVQQVLLARGIQLCEYSVYASRCMPVLQEHAPWYCAVVRVRRWMQVDDSTRVIHIGYHVRWVESLDAHCCNLPYLSDSAWRD